MKEDRATEFTDLYTVVTHIKLVSVYEWMQ